MNFLIIDDDIFLTSKIKYLFEKNKSINLIKIVNSYVDFLDEISIIEIYDVILLDINLGIKGKNGTDLIKIIRNKNLLIPIIIISGNDDIGYIDLFFNLGANDYIIKPFRFEELLVRVLKWFKNGFYNNSNFNNNLISYNGLIYDINKNSFNFNGSELILTKKSKYLLSIFFSYNEKFLSKDFLTYKLFGNYEFIETDNIRIYIYRLKSSLKKFNIDGWIKNIRGEGYIFQK
ncbi:MAG: response regulator transcription factor [Candidatus Gracilibacteria bacterium]|nr:response regulator transcription factor [Candidatus Gracilibacteria bacterium]